MLQEINCLKTSKPPGPDGILHKAGKLIELISNYRPISLCSIPSKIFERIMVKRLLEHSQKCGIPDSQHGFLPKRSCTTQAVSLFHEWAKILDRSTPPRIDAVFLDWAKAFDKVNHHVLLKKLWQSAYFE